MLGHFLIIKELEFQKKNNLEECLFASINRKIKNIDLNLEN